MTIPTLCDARYWRLTFLATHGSLSLNPRALVSSIRLYGMATPSPPPPPLPPSVPPPSPSLPIYKPDYEEFERERLRCVDRELLAIARAKVVDAAVLSDLPASSSCGWSASDALVAVSTVASLEPFATALDQPAEAPARARTAPSPSPGRRASCSRPRQT